MSRRTALALEVVFPLVVVGVIWWSSLESGTYYLPALPTVMESFNNTWLSGHAGTDLLPSLARLAAGLLLATVGGVTVGLLLGRVPRLARACSPVIEFCRALPAPVIIPAMILVLGIDDIAKIALIAFGCVWPVLLTTIDGVRGIDPLQIETARAYGLTRADTLRHIIVPAATPQIVAGVRTALSIGIILMVISEMIASANGVGYFVLESQRTFAMPEMWAGIIMLGLLGFLLNGALALVEAHVLAWYHATRTRSSTS